MKRQRYIIGYVKRLLSFMLASFLLLAQTPLGELRAFASQGPDPVSYTITYDTASAAAFEAGAPTSAEEGETVSFGIAAGYEKAGFYYCLASDTEQTNKTDISVSENNGSFEMPAEAVTVYVTYVYTAEHYRQTVTDGTPGYDSTPYFTEYTQNEPAVLAYEGYTNDATKNVTGDASGTAYEFYYDINSYEVTLDNGLSDTENATTTLTAYHNVPITVTSDFTRPGYYISGWSDGTNPYTDGGSYAFTAQVTLTAQWEKTEYTLNYDKNSGAATPDGTESLLLDDEANAVVLKTYDITAYTGYTFLGWADEATDTEPIFAPGDEVYISAVTASELTLSTVVAEGETAKTLTLALTGTPATSFTLYGVWAQNEYTVSLDAKGGSLPENAISPLTIHTGDTFTPPAPTRTGYDFSGWSGGGATFAKDGSWTVGGVSVDTSSGTSVYSLALSGTENKTVTLTTGEGAGKYSFALNALWDAKTYEITFDGNTTDTTYSCDTQKKNVTYAGTYGELPAPTRTGWTFAGWYTAQTDGNKIIADSTVDITTNTTLYAHWTENSYTVTFNNGGGTGADYTQSFTYTESKALRPNAFTRDGCSFAGWSDGTTTYTDGQTVASLTAVDGGSITLTAQWKLNAPNVTLSAGESAWTNQDVTATATTDCKENGVTVTVYFGGSELDKMTGSNGSFSYTFDSDRQGELSFVVSLAGVTSSESATKSIKLDKTVPTGAVKTDGGSFFTELLSTLTFGLWKNNSVSFGLYAGDDLSGVAKMEYMISTAAYTKEALEALASQTWTQVSPGASDDAGYSAKYVLSYDNSRVDTAVIAYLKLTDNAGNVTYRSSGTGVVLDYTKPVISTSISYPYLENGSAQTGNRTETTAGTADYTGSDDSAKMLYTTGAATVSVSFADDYLNPSETLTYSITPSDGTITETGVSRTAKDWSGTVTVGGDGWTEGSYTLNISVTDEAGNRATLKTATICYDKTAPVTGLSAGAYASDTWTGLDVTLSAATTGENSGVDHYEYYIVSTQSTLKIEGSAPSTSDAAPSSKAAVYSGTSYGADLALTVGNGSSFSGTVYVRAVDRAGNRGEWASYIVKLDKTPPTASLDKTGTAGLGEWFTGDVTVTVTAGDADSGLKNWRYFASTTVTNAADITNWNSMQTWDTVDPNTLTISTDGDWNVWVQVFDNVGNSKIEQINVKRDETKPSMTDGDISVTQPGSGGLAALLKRAVNVITFNAYRETITVKVEATDAASGVANFRVSGGNENAADTLALRLSAQGYTQPEGTYYRVPVTSGQQSAVFTIDAQYRGTLNVVPVDAAGNVCDRTATKEILVDNEKPVATLTYSGDPAIGSCRYFGKAASQITVDITVEDYNDNIDLSGDAALKDPQGNPLSGWCNVSVTHVPVNITQGGPSANGSSVSAWTHDEAAGTWKCTVTIDTPPDGTRDGDYIIKVSGADAAGNGLVISDSSSYIGESAGEYTLHTLIVDTLAPEFTYSPPVSSWTNRDVTCAFGITDAGGIAWWKQGAAEHTISDPRRDGTSVSGSHTFSQNGSVTIYARDAAGNESQYTIQMNWIDKIGPTIGTPSKSPSGEWSNKDVTVSAWVSDAGGSGVGSVSYSGTGVNAVSGGAVMSSGGYSFTLTGEQDASYVFSAGDRAGNRSGSSAISVKIDKTAPTGSITVGKLGVWQELIAKITFGLWTFEEQTVSIAASDPVSNRVQSGMSAVQYWLYTGDDDLLGGATGEKAAAAIEKSAVWKSYEKPFDIEDDMQFVVYAKLTDKAGNITYLSSDGIIVDTNAPYAGDKDSPIVSISTDSVQGGVYGSNVTVHFTAEDPGVDGVYSGIKTVAYQVLVDGKPADYPAGAGYSASSGTLFTFVEPEDGVKKEDLVTKVGSDKLYITIPKQIDSNRVTVLVTATDNALNVTEQESDVLKIDDTWPVVRVSFTGSPVGGKYFAAPRTATITVTELNFSEADVDISTNGSAGRWQHSADGLTHTLNVSFSSDGQYNFSMRMTDMAGHAVTNEQVSYSGASVSSFVVDTTAPRVEVSFTDSDGRAIEEGGYSPKAVTAVITVTETNFDPAAAGAGVSITMDGRPVSWPVSWSSQGGVHTARILFEEDGEYVFGIAFRDLAGNASGEFESVGFFVDISLPVITVEGLELDSINSGAHIAPTVTVTDKYYDPDAVELTLTGARYGVISGGRTAGDIENGQRFVFENLPRDDIYTLTASVKDRAGNVASTMSVTKDGRTLAAEEFKFYVNRTGSEYSLDGDSQAMMENYYITGAADITVVERNPNGISGWQLVLAKDLGDQLVLREGEDYTVERGEAYGGWSETVYTVRSNAVFEKDGAYSLYLTSSDEAGNKNANDAAGCDVNFFVDSVRPTLEVEGLESGGVYTADVKTVVFTVEDDTLQSIVVELNGKTAAEWAPRDILGSRITASFDINRANAAQTVSIIARDKAGNENELAGREYDHVFVTTNMWIRFYANTALFYGVLGGVAVAAVALVSLSYYRKRLRSGGGGES